MQLDLFNSPASVTCQRWQDRTPSWRHPRDGGFDATRYTATILDATHVRTWVERHHYAGTWPATRLVIGMTTDDPRLAPADAPDTPHGLLVGAAALSIPMSERALTNVFPNLEPYTETLELGRFILAPQVPANGETWLLGRMLRLAAGHGLRGIVSFSDPMPRVRTRPDGTRQIVSPGHVGLIYQAANATPCGRSTPRRLTVVGPHSQHGGTVLSDRSMQKLRAGERGADGVERRLVALGARPRRAGETVRAWLPDVYVTLGIGHVHHPGNFRYAWTLGTRATRRRTTIALPRTRNPKPATDLLPIAAWQPPEGAPMRAPTTLTPWTRTPGDPARATTFYLGTHQPRWLETSPVPLFVSLSRLSAYKRTGEDFPKARIPYAIDSGGFSEIDAHGQWRQEGDEFGSMVARIVDDLGAPPKFVACQDWMCEPDMLARTGLTVADHQDLTLTSYLHLVDNFPWLPWAPVLQGQTLADYLTHADAYRAAGVDLPACGTVGLGSVCRRESTAEIGAIVGALHARGLHNLHGFGVKRGGFQRYGHMLASADSLAWSSGARIRRDRLDDCDHVTADCRNCHDYALAWRENTLAGLRRPAQLGLGLGF